MLSPPLSLPQTGNFVSNAHIYAKPGKEETMRKLLQEIKRVANVEEEGTLTYRITEDLVMMGLRRSPYKLIRRGRFPDLRGVQVKGKSGQALWRQGFQEHVASYFSGKWG
jgi:hypothetical protein